MANYELGMCHERLSPSEPHKALTAYAESLPLFSALQSEFSHKSLPKSSGKLDFTFFHQLRELWRWVERLLWRAVVLSSRTTDLQTDDEMLWIWLGHYASCGTFWPSTFRTAHRSTVYAIHLRALVLKNRFLSPSPLDSSQHTLQQSVTPSTTTPSSASSTFLSLNGQPPTSGSWLHSARTVVHEYRGVLTSSTKFPRAGERNMQVENFVDLCVAVWEAAGANGEQAGWVIDVCACLSPYIMVINQHPDPLVGNPIDVQLIAGFATHVALTVPSR